MSSDCYVILVLEVLILSCQRLMPCVHSTPTLSLIGCKLFILKGLDLAIGRRIENVLESNISDLLSKKDTVIDFCNQILLLSQACKK